MSWGLNCIDYPGVSPGVYARVTAQLDWIRNSTAEEWSTCSRGDITFYQFIFYHVRGTFKNSFSKGLPHNCCIQPES